MNELRHKNNLPLLDIHTVDLLHAVPEHVGDEEEEKISSSNHRMRLLGMRLREPEVKSPEDVLCFILLIFSVCVQEIKTNRTEKQIMKKIFFHNIYLQNASLDIIILYLLIFQLTRTPGSPLFDILMNFTNYSKIFMRLKLATSGFFTRAHH